MDCVSGRDSEVTGRRRSQPWPRRASSGQASLATRCCPCWMLLSQKWELGHARWMRAGGGGARRRSHALSPSAIVRGDTLSVSVVERAMPPLTCHKTRVSTSSSPGTGRSPAPDPGRMGQISHHVPSAARTASVRPCPGDAAPPARCRSGSQCTDARSYRATEAISCREGSGR